MKIGWIGLGRMGLPMAERLVKAGHAVTVWNRTASKMLPLIEQGAKAADRLEALRDVDVLFLMLSTGEDVSAVCFGRGGVASDPSGPVPRTVVDCSSIGIEESSGIRERLAALGVEFLAAPVSGNAKCVRIGVLSSVVSGPRSAFEKVRSLIEAYAPKGVSYVGEGELARICKIAHNVMLGVVTENLIEITLLAQKAGVARHTFLAFLNDSVMGSIFTRYKSPALVNLDFTTTFTASLLRKDLDLGLEEGRRLGVPMPATAAVREVVQSHVGLASRRADAAEYLEKDFTTLIETMALGAGIKISSEDVTVASGLER